MIINLETALECMLRVDVELATFDLECFDLDDEFDYDSMNNRLAGIRNILHDYLESANIQGNSIHGL
jgi:hypothetical protein